MIEYQGAQHGISVEWFGGNKYFKKQKEHDKRKREYAENNNIKLIEIWYYNYNDIEKILIDELKFNHLTHMNIIAKHEEEIS